MNEKYANDRMQQEHKLENYTGQYDKHVNSKGNYQILTLEGNSIKIHLKLKYHKSSNKSGLEQKLGL